MNLIQTYTIQDISPLLLYFTGTSIRVYYSEGLIGSDIVIDWGDGTTTNYIDANSLNHTYSVEGDYVIQITGNITSIGYYGFRGVSGFTSVVIPEGVTSLGDYCFSSGNLNSIILPNTLTSIGSSCFSGCNLTTINIPESVTSLGGYCFGSNPNLISMVLNWKNDNIVEYDSSMYDGWAQGYSSSLKFSIPSGTLQDYINAGYPSDKLIER